MKINPEKLKYIRKSRDISQEDLGKKLGGLIKQNISSWENGNREVPVKYHQPLCEILNINLEELCTEGKSEVAPLNPSDTQKVPVLSFAQAAGYEPALEPLEVYANNCADAYETFSNVKQGYFALTVEGDSMSPQLPDGSTVLVAGGQFPERGDVVVARLRDGQVVIKHYCRRDNVIRLESFNPAGKSFQWHCKEDPGFIQWMFPVVEAKIDLRKQRWENCCNGGGNTNIINDSTEEYKVAEPSSSYKTKGK